MNDSEPSTETFTPIQYEPDNPASITRRGTPVQAGSSRYSPYARSTTSSKPSTSLASASMMGDAEGPQCPLKVPQPSMKDYDATQTLAVHWAQKRLIMDSVFEGWIRNTKDEKANMDTRVTEIISQANIKFNCMLLPSKYLKDCIINALIKNRRALAKKAENFVHLYNLEPL
ncbi:uncharacterized protein F5891DRAFT_1193662 [Suillus fuscotomentosus]|uniref:Uncharacterized protein n=1 Tax=Suillus fuscotomentosus TaxID=1912939 RepID=A0AAD4DZR7_9AGAM|nr:uncharacterized protein F5891DRAFT_1193662 [Suillus fuscotomentosus]KAG1895849.1 hypothetical protein F5891DRAFT_1193662 [Suillus fuscotomentosus]